MSRLRAGPVAMVLTAAIVVLTLATAYIHTTLGSTTSLLGLLFYANAAGYTVLALALIARAAGWPALVRRFSWLPAVALLGFAATTIAGYLIVGPYSTLGWLTKGIELVIIALLVIDLLLAYDSPGGLYRAAKQSVFGGPDETSPA